MPGKSDGSKNDVRGIGDRGTGEKGIANTSIPGKQTTSQSQTVQNQEKPNTTQQTASPSPSPSASRTAQNRPPPPPDLIDLAVPESDAEDERDIKESLFENLFVRFAYAYELFFRPYKFIVVEFRDQYLQTERKILLHTIAPFTKDFRDDLAEKIVGGSSWRKKEFDDHNFQYDETERIYMEKIKKKIDYADAILKKVENEGILSTSPPMDIAIASFRESYLSEIRKELDLASLGLRLIAMYDEAARASLASTDLNIDATPVQKNPWRLTIDPQYIRDNKFHKDDIPHVLRYLKLALDENNKQKDIRILTLEVDALQKQIESNIEEFTKRVKVQQFIQQLIKTVEVMINIILTVRSLRGGGMGGGMGGESIRCALAVGGIVRYSNGGAIIAKSLTSKQIAELIKQGIMVISTMAMSSGGSGVGNVPSLENVRGVTVKSKDVGGVTKYVRNPKRDGTLFLQRGLVVRSGPGGIVKRIVQNFTKIVRDDKGFELAKKGFLKDLSRDPKVIEFFGEKSPEIKNMGTGLAPSEYWEVHHNIPATAKVKGINVNDPSNFSLMPKWVHQSVTVEYNRMLTLGVKSYEFPIFDRAVLWKRSRDVYAPIVKNPPAYKYNP